jgi:AraC family transcriptional regulator
VNERSHACDPGTAIYRDAGAAHSDAYESSGAYVCLVLGEGSAAGHGYDALRGASRVVRHPELRTIGVRLANEIHHRAPWSSLALQGLGLEACAMIGRADANGDLASPRAIKRILDLLDADPAADLTIERIAIAVGESPSYVARAFRRYAGVGIAEYLRRIRLDRVRALLATGVEPVADIAMQAGYYDQSHLNRAFRRAFGITPIAYRRECRR